MEAAASVTSWILIVLLGLLFAYGYVPLIF